jgi:hypothetical protein
MDLAPDRVTRSRRPRHRAQADWNQPAFQPCAPLPFAVGIPFDFTDSLDENGRKTNLSSNIEQLSKLCHAMSSYENRSQK